MDARRLTLKTAMLERQARSITDCPLSQAMFDLDAYETAGNLDEAMMKIAPSVVWTAVSEELSAKATNASSLNAGALRSPAEAGYSLQADIAARWRCLVA
ncbi:MAG: hypothetical protein EON94_00090 [Caulobacteraceae bacterium]|nr:MAG: hypothetical protein EON94_00090 [Caulobacteraceae bacterium]